MIGESYFKFEGSSGSPLIIIRYTEGTGKRWAEGTEGTGVRSRLDVSDLCH